MSTKALLIKSYTNLSTGTAGEWNELNMAPSYIQGIKTGKILDEMSSDKLAALISGVPTPWARARLFKFALQTLNAPDPNIDSSGLQQFYEMLHGEWRGLLAVMALYPDRVSFSSPVSLNGNGGSMTSHRPSDACSSTIKISGATNFSSPKTPIRSPSSNSFTTAATWSAAPRP